MAITPKETIAQQREAIAKARTQAQRLAKPREVSKAELLRRDITARARAKGEAIKRERYAKRRLAEIAKAEKEFELGVGVYEAEKAKYEEQVIIEPILKPKVPEKLAGPPIPPTPTREELIQRRIISEATTDIRKKEAYEKAVSLAEKEYERQIEIYEKERKEYRKEKKEYDRALKEAGITIYKGGIYKEGKKVGDVGPKGEIYIPDIPKEPLKFGVYETATGKYLGPGGPTKPTLEDISKKLGIDIDKLIKPVEVTPYEEPPKPSAFITEYKGFTEEQIEEFKKLERRGKWRDLWDKIKEYTEKLIIPIPFEKKMAEKEFEILREEGKYVPFIKDKELIGAKLVTPGEVPYYEAQAEIASIADETGRELLDKYTTQRDNEMNTYMNKLQDNVTAGKINVNEANKQLEDYNRRYGELLDKEMQREYTNILSKDIGRIQGLAEEKSKEETKKYRLNISLANLPLTIVAGAIISGISVVALPLGVTYMAIQSAQLVTHIPETLSYVRAAPLAAGAEFGGFMVGGMVGGGLVRGVKLKYIAKSDLKAAIAKLPKIKQVEFMKYWNDIKKLEAKAWYVPTRNVDFTGMKRLPTRLHNPTKAFLKSKGDILGGSQGMRTMMHGKARPSLSRWVESDLDIYTRGNPITRATALADLYKSYGIKRVSTVKGKVTIEGAKVAEFHSVEMLYGNLRSVTPYYQSLRSNIRTTPEGIKVAPILSAQAKRKLVGSYLDSRYSKDFPDFMKIEQALIQEAGILKRLGLPEPKPIVKDLIKIEPFKVKKAPPTKIEPFKVPKILDPFKTKVKRVPKVKEYPYVPYPKAKTLPFLVPPYPGYKKPKIIAAIIPYKIPTKIPKITPLIPYKPIVPYKVTRKVPTIRPIVPYKVPYKVTRKVPTIRPIIPIKVPTKRVEVRPVVPYRPTIPYKPTKPVVKVPLIVPIKQVKIRPPIRFKRRVPPKKKKRIIKRKAKPGDYTGYIRRFRKWKQISRGSKAQATAQVKRKIKKELGASYKVQGPAPSKKYVMLPITKQFRRSKSKKEPYVVIEKRKYRLDSPKEVREIKAAKRAASKKPEKRKSNIKRNIFFK